MSTPVLVTKLYIPPLRTRVVRRRLIERLNEGLDRKLTLICAPAGFGKTTLVSEWVAESPRPIAWLSLDEADNDPVRFLTYLVAALRTVAPDIGTGVLGALQSPQPPSTESLLTALLNEITMLPNEIEIVLVLDDYHVIDAKSVDVTVAFLLDNAPPRMHLVIATREDPPLPVARLRVRGQLSELRAADLRFTVSESAEFLNPVMGLDLSKGDIAALEDRTEGWIAGLQLAAISMQGHRDTTSFIQSFTGSHHFVLDYLVEEVLSQQPERIQQFLLRTSALDRLCGPLCDAVSPDPSVSGQDTLESIERANLFLVPLDNERRWYRYHHLFAELLRQRLRQGMAGSMDRPRREDRRQNHEDPAAEYHRRASGWFEENGLAIEAFQQAAAAHDTDRAARLIEGDGIPQHSFGAVTMLLGWLESLPVTTLNARPTLWLTFGSLLLTSGQTTGVEQKLQAAHDALEGSLSDTEARHLAGRIASARAVLALTRYQPETIIVEACRALEYLDPKSFSTRASVNWTLGFAHVLLGNRAGARQAFTEAIPLSEVSGDSFTTILATGGLGHVQESDNQLSLAAATYRGVLRLAGDQPLPILSGAHLGLAQIHYEWNDLDAAEQHGQQSLLLARQFERVIDRYIVSEVFLARLRRARGDVSGAAAMLAKTLEAARQHNFVHRLPQIAAAQVLTLLDGGNLDAAAQLAETYGLPLSQGRVLLAQGQPLAALTVLGPLREQADARGWQDERLAVMVLQVLAHRAKGDIDTALHLLHEVLALAEPAGMIRLFVDEGLPMAKVLSEAAARGIMPDYVSRLLAVIGDAFQPGEGSRSLSTGRSVQSLVEPLSQRELEVLRLVAQGLSNHQIAERLFLAVSTIKGHNRVIFEKLQVQRRTEAVARALELDLL